MASVLITISNPTLGVGESFRERHRLLPAGAWSSYTTRTNAPFGLTLTEGEWEIEIALVQDDGTVCPAVFRRVNVIEPEAPDPPDPPEPYECPDFTVTQLANPSKLMITYSGGTPATACGYKVEYYAGFSPYKTVNYATLPASPFYVAIPYINKSVHVRITANSCNGSIVCFEADIPAPAPEPCVPLNAFDYQIEQITGQPLQKQTKYRVTITATSPLQSTIPTTSTTLNIVQGYTLFPANPWTASIPKTGISPTLFSVTFEVYHNYPYSAPTPPIYWSVSFVDGCGKSHLISVEFP